MYNLSDEQKNVVEYSIGKPICLIASAGSGKTRVITERIKYILSHTNRESIVAITFTNKASEEMQDRLSNQDNIEERCFISTIHSLAQSIVESYGHTIGLADNLHIYERAKDKQQIFLQSFSKNGLQLENYFTINNEKQYKKEINEWFEKFANIKRELLYEDDIEDHATSLLFNNYQNNLLESGGIDFDDLIYYAYKILMNNHHCRRVYQVKYKHILIDEAQDLNKSQYEFIKMFCGDNQSILMVGDPNQNIYSFNGSSANYLCEKFSIDFKFVKKLSLTKNYRSSTAIINLSNKIKKNAQKNNDSAIEGKSDFKEYCSDVAEAEGIRDEIKKIISQHTHTDIEGNITLDNMVVIARNRFQFTVLQGVLEKANINYILNKSEYNVEPTSLSGKILDFAIRVKLNPKDWIAQKSLAKLLDVNQSTQQTLDTISHSIQNNGNIPYYLSQKLIINSVNNLDVDSPKIHTICEDIIKTLQEEENDCLDGKEDEKERSILEITELKDNFIKFKNSGLGESLYSFRNALVLGKLQQTTIHENAILLSTVHTMKGLEKDIVFLMGMYDGGFPDYRADTQEKLDEESNNLFVAITRAKRWIFISYPKKRQNPWNSDGFYQCVKSRLLENIV